MLEDCRLARQLCEPRVGRLQLWVQLHGTSQPDDGTGAVALTTAGRVSARPLDALRSSQRSMMRDSCGRILRWL